MAVKLRLTRRGAKKKPFYRIVAADTESPRDGRFLEIVGTYDPNLDPAVAVLHDDKLNYWLEQGAVATPTVASIIKKARKAAPEASA
ncbi:MAG: 30S ribosomal protein S16 [Deltaproteobacteria bacterium]|nr:30S ribosomal protein S16 [Candidatus Tharpella aukensis]